jgi:hypothetical protein
MSRCARQVHFLGYPDVDVLKVKAGLSIKRALISSSLVLDLIPPQFYRIKSIFSRQSRMFTDQIRMKYTDGNELFCDIEVYE